MASFFVCKKRILLYLLAYMKNQHYNDLYLPLIIIELDESNFLTNTRLYKVVKLQGR